MLLRLPRLLLLLLRGVTLHFLHARAHARVAASAAAVGDCAMWFYIAVLLSVLLATAQGVDASFGPEQRRDDVDVQLFPSATPMRPQTFPEYSAVKHKPNVGLSFSGGSTRSFESTLGYLRGLHDLKLLDKFRYVSAVSGGTWAVAGFTFHDSTRVSLEDYLGHPTQPEDIDLRDYGSIAPTCARGFPVRSNLINVLVEDLLVNSVDPIDVWVSAIHRVFLRPAGIEIDALPAWSREQVAQVLARNPHLLDRVKFALPCGGYEPCRDRPFPIFNTAMLGPLEAAPFTVESRSYAMMDITPLYTGFPLSQSVPYPQAHPPTTVSLGGLVEPIGFGSHTELDFCGLVACPDQAVVRIPLPTQFFSLANATAASSWAPGAIVAENEKLRPLHQALMRVPYFSPLLGGIGRDLFLGDGGNLENQGFIALLQRGVDRAVLFINANKPLVPRKEYNPYKRLPTDHDIDFSFAALFGVRLRWNPKPGQDFVHDKVFSYLDYVRVVDMMQTAQATGKGCVVTVTLTTMLNRWWGIRAGHKVGLTVVYLSRAYEWEAKLKPEKAAVLAPQSNDPNKLPEDGPFKGFPHINSNVFHLTSQVANSLADLAWWVVVNNAAVFEREALAVIS